MAIHETSKVKQDAFGVTVQLITSCARCGETHKSLWFSPFTRPVVDSDGTVSNYWATCPVTREPILMAMQKEQTLEVQNGRK